jgi:hypothetical protein
VDAEPVAVEGGVTAGPDGASVADDGGRPRPVGGQCSHVVDRAQAAPHLCQRRQPELRVAGRVDLPARVAEGGLESRPPLDLDVRRPPLRTASPDRPWPGTSWRAAAAAPPARDRCAAPTRPGGGSPPTPRATPCAAPPPARRPASAPGDGAAPACRRRCRRPRSRPVRRTPAAPRSARRPTPGRPPAGRSSPALRWVRSRRGPPAGSPPAGRRRGGRAGAVPYPEGRACRPRSGY